MTDKPRVLVLDDEPHILTSIRDLLEDDFVVLTAVDGQTALGQLEREEVAVILSDQRMPGLSGDQFLKKAAEISQATRILITAYADMEALIRAVNHGQIYAYISKPSDPMELKVTVLRAAHHYELVQEIARERDLLELRVQERTAETTRLNEALRERVRELIAVNKELEAFTYSASHDLRGPLRHIDAFSQIILDDFGPCLPAEAQQRLRQIRQAVSEMSTMVDGLLNLSRLGRRELNKEITGLRSLVEAILAELEPDMKGRDVRVQIGDLPFAECDPVLIKIVLHNLLSNAIKFTRTRKQAVIDIGQGSRQGRRVIFVRDNGVGFSMKYANKLFGVFQRLHRREDFEGTGVGLATVQRIVHKHGGEIWAEAELDKGATFFFTLEASVTPASD